MLHQWRAARERRRLDAIYGDPRAAKPKPVYTTWRRRHYWQAVIRTLAVNFILAAAMGGTVWWLWNPG